ncbi:Gfo/Idh/MocA family protein [Candidatus Magnetominusculus dajiuhuensis]|uniref:Gfo/Idh/MocA family protein n=1 Tax=Candidatus Magnetominusculus dajiuhuensis TaxID=3137712 RepID=UPI003B439BD7
MRALDDKAPLRVGLIGVGYFGKHHGRIVSELDGAVLTAVCDADLSRAEEAARRYTCQAFTSVEQALPLADAFIIATPTQTHNAIAMKCLRAGKHVFVEKPITGGVDEADQLIDEANARGLTLQVGHVERYNSGFRNLCALLDAPAYIETQRLSPLIERAVGIDVTLDLMIHDIDIVLSISNSPVKSINAAGASVLTSRIDTAKAWIEFESGMKAFLSVGRLSSDKLRTLRVSQRNELLFLDYQSGMITKYIKNGSSIKAIPLDVPPMAEPLKEELRSFVESVLTGKTPMVSGECGREALSLALRIGSIIRESVSSVMI